jgi:coatomer subunit beta'
VRALKIAKEDKEPGSFSFLRKKNERKLEALPAKFIARKQWLASGDGFGYIHVHKYTRSGGGPMSVDKINKFYGHTGAVTSLAVHPTEPFVLSASVDKQIKLWDWDNGWKRIRIFKGHKYRVHQVVFNPRKSSTFASVSVDGTILVSRPASMHETYFVTAIYLYQLLLIW